MFVGDEVPEIMSTFLAMKFASIPKVLHLALELEDTRILRGILHSYPEHVYSCDENGLSPLSKAARSGYWLGVHLLLLCGADSKQVDSNPSGWTPDIHAHHSHHVYCEYLLLTAIGVYGVSTCPKRPDDDGGKIFYSMQTDRCLYTAWSGPGHGTGFQTLAEKTDDSFLQMSLDSPITSIPSGIYANGDGHLVFDGYRLYNSLCGTRICTYCFYGHGHRILEKCGFHTDLAFPPV